MTEDEPGGAAGATRRSFGSLGSIIFPLILAWTAFLALRPLNDNSFFTHLATGRLILDRGSVPSADPYTFTAQGEPWTVQSWLASVAYAAAEELGGAFGLRLLILVVFLTAGAVLWRLTRPATSVFVRLALAAATMTVASSVWSERPYMIGFIGLGLVLLALDGDMTPWILVPFTWVWVNTHGSYPLAVVLCLTVLLGEWLDQRRSPDRATDLREESRTLAAVVGGVLLGALSPLGVDALLFPLRSVTQSESFAQIVEWRAPEFTSIPERVFLVLAVAAIAAVIANRRWRHAVPLLVFIAAALLARRNIVMALPILAVTFASAAPRIGTLRSRSVPVGGPVLAALTWSLVPLVMFVGASAAPLGLGGYPGAALSFVDAHPSDGRVVTQDFAGNLLEVLDGPTGQVFVDDRADMFPPAVLEDYQTLNRGRLGWTDVFRRYESTTVVWDRSHPLASVLVADPAWRIEYSDADWVVARRR